MSQDWPTKENDMQAARLIIQEYALANNQEMVGLFEVVVRPEKKYMDYELCDWVLAIAQYFSFIYGITQGDVITRRVISQCMIQGESVH